MYIQIDYREKSRAKKAKEYYEEKNHEVSIESLETGDYVFDEKVVFEFKTYSDMFASIMDRRVFDESHRQAEKYPWHYVMIAGNDKSRRNAQFKLVKMNIPFNINQYYGAIASLNTYTRVIYAPNVPKSFRIMECQAKKCLDGKVRVRTPKTKTENPAFNLLMFLPEIKEHRAKLLVEELNLKNFEDLRRITYDDLVGVKGIGEKTTETILTSLGTYGIKIKK